MLNCIKVRIWRPYTDKLKEFIKELLVNIPIAQRAPSPQVPPTPQAIQSKEVDDHAVEEERRIENEILEILRRRESIWKQRSRELWLAKGDRNTSFFHAATVVRKRRNQILVLLDDNGSSKENEATKEISEWVLKALSDILLNGKPQKKTYPGRGLRQGDPISPYLFVLCNDVLSRMLDRSQDRGDIHGIKISREAPAVTHLMFADDTLLFSRANTMEASIIGDCIKKFEGWSGQMCSKQKSGILFSSNCVKSMKENIEAQLGISTINDEEKYLGNPFVFSRRRKKDFDFIRSKLKQRLEGWKMRTLSYAGRMVAVSSIASAIPSYSMSTFQLPLSSCRELDALIRKFWWNGSLEKQRFLATISWDSLCRPKWSGGLGFRRMEDVNNALLSKLAWLLASGDRRAVNVALQARYFPRESFWSVQKKNGDSFIWRGILDSRQVILQGSCMVIYRESINLWYQQWIPWLSYEDFRELMESIRCKAPSLLWFLDLMYRREKKWNTNYLCFLFGEDLGKRISHIQIAQELGNDLLIWKEANRGVFTVKEAYLMGQKSRFGSIEPLWKWIWKENLHPRMRMIL
uniref:Reverse transcriptase domain-containing protein n=1 Tax=Cannabis sativa TaxID=3483 RepID=A0A803PFQ0_CANSA